MLVLFGNIDIVLYRLMAIVSGAPFYTLMLLKHHINHNGLYHKCIKILTKFSAHVLTEF